MAPEPDASQRSGERGAGAADLGPLGSLGQNLRSLRHQAGLTTTELARRSDVTQPFVSQVENGHSVPSVVTLLRFADALGVDLHSLIDGQDAELEVSLVRQSDQHVYVVAGDDRATARVLTHGRSDVEALEFTADADAWLGDSLEHAGTDFVYVTSGRLLVDLGEHGRHELGPGDSLCHSGRMSHRWSVASDEAVTFVCVVIATAGTGAERHTT